MKISKKITLVSLFSLAIIVSFGLAHVKGTAKGELPNWDPENYVSVEANGMTFSVNVRGDKSNTPVILLHGFPESSVMWDKFMDELAEKNYYSIAPNQRGYSSGARPLDVNAYEVDYLISDVLQIADRMGVKQFHLIGHDWGAAVGWKLAADHPERVASYAAISVPHIDSFGKAYREDPEQYESSDYIRFFQKKTLPEYALAQGDYDKLTSIWNAHDQSEIDHYLNIFKQEYALTSAINWYRANFSAFETGLNVGKVNVPTTFIWGNQDIALKRSGVAGTRDLVDAEYKFIEMEAGHWIIQEKYSELSKHLFEHLAKFR